MNMIRSSKLLVLAVITLHGHYGFSQNQGELRPAEIQARQALGAEAVFFGAQVGLVNVDNLTDNVVSIGAFGDYGLSDQFMAGGSVNYWRDTSGIIGGNPVEVSDFSIGAHGRWVFTNINTPFRPFALAGLAVHRIRVALSERIDDDLALAQFSQVYEDIEARIGADIAGGVMYAIDDQIDVIGEIRHRNLFDDKIRFDQWSFSGSLSYRL